MYNLAVLTDSRKEKSIMPLSSQLKLFYSSTEDQVLEQLAYVDGVLVDISSLEKPTKIYEFMLSINRKGSLPVWVWPDIIGEENNRVLLELGSLGYLDSKLSDEENFVLIENTLKLIYKLTPKVSASHKAMNTPVLKPTNSTFRLGEKEDIHLTRMEYRLIKYLSSRVNQAFTYEEIYEEVWGEKVDITKEMKRYRIANMVFHIRTKLGEYGYSADVLRTVRSIGYMLDIKE